MTDDIKKERVRMSKEVLAMVRCRSMTMTDNTVTMDETAVSFYTPEINQQSRQWLPKGQPDSVKTTVHGLLWQQGPDLHKPSAQGTAVNAKYYILPNFEFRTLFQVRVIISPLK
jgi:hypothetical protein